MQIHYLKTSSNGKNILLSISCKELSAMAIRKAGSADYIDISSLIAEATLIVSGSVYNYVFDILLESIGIEGVDNMYYIHLTDEDESVNYCVSYLAPAYFSMFDKIKKMGDGISMKDYLYITRVFMLVEGHRMAMEYERYDEAEYLFDSIMNMDYINWNRFKTLEPFPTI